MQSHSSYLGIRHGRRPISRTATVSALAGLMVTVQTGACGQVYRGHAVAPLAKATDEALWLWRRGKGWDRRMAALPAPATIVLSLVAAVAAGACGQVGDGHAVAALADATDEALGFGHCGV